MKKYKVGDRVRVYGHTGRSGGLGSFLHGTKGTVVPSYMGVEWDTEIKVKLDPDPFLFPNGETFDFHTNQCRKLRKPFIAWVNLVSDHDGNTYLFGKPSWSEEDAIKESKTYSVPVKSIQLVRAKGKKT